MSYVILGNGESAQKLAEKLGGRTQDPSELSYWDKKVLCSQNRVINWGWSTTMTHVNKLKHWVKDKHEASVAMDEAGVNCALYKCLKDIDYGWIKTPFMVRKARHSKGSDVRVYNRPFNMEPLDHDDFVVEIFDKEREYRVHVAFGKVIKIQRKVPEYEEDMIWNQDSCHFQRVDANREAYNSIKDLSIKALEALNLDIGAVDVGVKNFRKEDQEDIVFEVNTAPAMNDDTAQRYANAIREDFDYVN